MNSFSAIFYPSPAAKIRLPERVEPLRIAGRLWVWILAVFVNFLVCLAVFPALTALVESTDRGRPGSTQWENKYFNPVGCFLLFNLGDYAGRCLASLVRWPGPTRAGAW